MVFMQNDIIFNIRAIKVGYFYKKNILSVFKNFPGALHCFYARAQKNPSDASAVVTV